MFADMADMIQEGILSIVDPPPEPEEGEEEGEPISIFERVEVGLPERVSLDEKPVCLIELVNTPKITQDLRSSNLQLTVGGFASILTKGLIEGSIPQCYAATDRVFQWMLQNKRIDGALLDVKAVQFGPASDRTRERRHLYYAGLILFEITRAYSFVPEDEAEPEP